MISIIPSFFYHSKYNLAIELLRVYNLYNKKFTISLVRVAILKREIFGIGIYIDMEKVIISLGFIKIVIE